MCLGAYAKSEYEKNQSWVFLYPGRLTSAAGRQARVVAPNPFDEFRQETTQAIDVGERRLSVSEIAI